MADDNEFTYDYTGLEATTTSASNFYGDWFPSGPKYRFRVRTLSKRVNKEDGKGYIDLEAVCVPGGNSDGACVGQTLKHSFGFPLPSERSDPKKNLGAAFWAGWVSTVGGPAMSGVVTVPLNAFAGREFDGTTRDYEKAAKTSTLPDGTSKVYPSKRTSFLENVYEVGSNVAAAQAPIAPPEVVSASEAEQAFAFTK